MKNRLNNIVAITSILFTTISGCDYIKDKSASKPTTISKIEKENKSIFVRKDSTYLMNEYILGEFYEKNAEDEHISLGEKWHNYTKAHTHYSNLSKRYKVAPGFLSEKNIYQNNIENRIKYLENVKIPSVNRLKRIENENRKRDRWNERIKKYGYSKKFFP